MSEAARQWDYWITAGDEPAGIVRRYTEVTGREHLRGRWPTGPKLVRIGATGIEPVKPQLHKLTRNCAQFPTDRPPQSSPPSGAEPAP